MGCPYVCNGTCMNTFAHEQHEHLCAVHMEGFYMGELVPSLEAANLARAALRTPSPTPRVAASEGETTTGRFGGRTRRRVSSKSLNWFDADGADDGYNNRIKHAEDAALEAKTMIKTVLSRALTRMVIPDEELREEFNALSAGAARLRYVTGHAGFSLMLDTMRRRLLAPKEIWPSSAEFAEENGELLLVCQPRWRK